MAATSMERTEQRREAMGPAMHSGGSQLREHRRRWAWGGGEWEVSTGGQRQGERCRAGQRQRWRSEAGYWLCWGSGQEPRPGSHGGAWNDLEGWGPLPACLAKAPRTGQPGPGRRARAWDTLCKNWGVERWQARGLRAEGQELTRRQDKPEREVRGSVVKPRKRWLSLC